MVASDIDMLLRDPGRYTHVELDPTVIFGPTTACIPFSDHNQAPRNIYQASMHKQAISMPTFSVEHRFDVHMYAMAYPTRPIVSTRVGNDPVVSMELPSGLSPIVASTSVYIPVCCLLLSLLRRVPCGAVALATP